MKRAEGVPRGRNVRRYLTGLDWVMASLDAEMRRVTGGGNHSQVVLGVDPRLNTADLVNRFLKFATTLPPLGSGIGRNPWNLAPYWKTGPVPGQGCLEGNAVELKADEDLHRVLEEHANLALPRNRACVRALAVNCASGTRFVLSFDHRVLDAFGAERLLSAFEERSGEAAPPPEAADYLRPNTPGLTGWGDKFRGGRFVNRMFLKLGETPCRRLTGPAVSLPAPFKFRHLEFDQEASEAIFERAWNKSGYLMEMAYFLAAATQALHSEFERRNVEGAGYIVPVTTDTRPHADPLGETFFNYASFLFFQLPLEHIYNRVELIRLLKGQMYEQVQNRFPLQVAEASSLLRIAPRSVVGRIMTATMKPRASFSFSYLGRSGYSRDRFCGVPVRSLFHMPRVPYPPGLGIFFNAFGGRLHVTLAWLAGLAEESAMEDVLDRLRSTL